MEILQIVLQFAVPIGTFVAGLFTGRQKKNNDFLAELQKSIDLLSAKNKELVHEVVNLRGETVQLKSEVVQLKSENAALRREVEDLNAKLANIKTITRTKT